MTTPAVDSPPLLCSVDKFTEGRYNDLTSEYSPQALVDLLSESTRLCEDACGRRLVPFRQTTTLTAQGVDPDEYSDSAAGLPMDIRSTLGASYAQALGASTLVRHVWLPECAPRYPEMWTYTVHSIQVYRSYGGNQPVSPPQILHGPEPETGHLWFQLGLFIPIGSRVDIDYEGGYSPIPASLVRAGKLMAASLAVSELDPAGNTGHDPAKLLEGALSILGYWGSEDN